MIISESNSYNIKRLNRVLDNIAILESDIYSRPSIIPITEVNSSYILSLEDLICFAENNTIDDLGQALYIVCEENCIDSNSISLSVLEENLLINDELQSFVTSLNECGIPIVLEHEPETIRDIENAVLLVEDWKEKLTGGKDQGMVRANLHGYGHDDAEGAKTVNKALDDSLLQYYKTKDTFTNDEQGQKDLESWKQGSDFFRQGANRENMFRHNVFGSGTYEGDIPAALGDMPMGMNAKNFREKVADLKKDRSWDEQKREGLKWLNRDAYDKGDKGNIGSAIYYKLIRAAILGMKSQSENREENLRDVVAHIEREQIPANIISRLIAKLRGLYQKFLIRYKSGSLENENQAKMIQQLDDAEKAGGGKVSSWKGSWISLKYLGRKMIHTFLGKIAWVIDRLLQWLQNKSNKYLWKDNIMAPKKEDNSPKHESYDYYQEGAWDSIKKADSSIDKGISNLWKKHRPFQNKNSFATKLYDNTFGRVGRGMDWIGDKFTFEKDEKGETIRSAALKHGLANAAFAQIAMPAISGPMGLFGAGMGAGVAAYNRWKKSKKK